MTVEHRLRRLLIEDRPLKVHTLLHVIVRVHKRLRLREHERLAIDFEAQPRCCRSCRHILFELNQGKWLSISVLVHANRHHLAKLLAQMPQSLLVVVLRQAGAVHRLHSLGFHLLLVPPHVLELHTLRFGHGRCPQVLLGPGLSLLHIVDPPQQVCRARIHDRDLASHPQDGRATHPVALDDAPGALEVDLSIVLDAPPRERPELHLLDLVALLESLSQNAL
mmetsp:Transcript_106624/g.340203  ORF Transcript_106624/g.340203 Transcript_106624/m.340203 type:complete len:222 (-) Transcript_106624:232-897(-)